MLKTVGMTPTARDHLERALELASASGLLPWLAERVRERLQAAPAPPILRIGPDARWFQRCDGPRVDLARRRAPRLVLHALARGGRPLDVDSLLAAGWPGERVLPLAAQTRVHTAIYTLRRLGLDGVLVRRDDGYLLDAAVTLDHGTDAGARCRTPEAA